VNEYRTKIKVVEIYFCLRITDTFRSTTKEERQTTGDKRRMTNDRGQKTNDKRQTKEKVQYEKSTIDDNYQIR